MPANLLTALDVERARPGFDPLAKKLHKPRPDPNAVFKLNDGAGLKLEVRPTGKKVWRYRYRIGADEQTFTIGFYGGGPGEYTLEAAREARAEARKLVKQGIHPGRQRAAVKAATV
ncbi:MAG TPA: Arm DNA-binding domain-containing protein, partial [Usitatibacter sp.]|nr:Arm DNA-binding domain-containing protein [Usitatibacter sp.]